MRSRSLFAFLLVLALATWSASSVGAAEEDATTTPAETEVATLEADGPEVETLEADAAEPAPAADLFLDQSLITVTPVHQVFCTCQVGVSCCGDPGVDISCGNRRYCVCNGLDQCVLQHVHPPK